MTPIKDSILPPSASCQPCAAGFAAPASDPDPSPASGSEAGTCARIFLESRRKEEVKIKEQNAGIKEEGLVEGNKPHHLLCLLECVCRLVLEMTCNSLCVLFNWRKAKIHGCVIQLSITSMEKSRKSKCVLSNAGKSGVCYHMSPSTTRHPGALKRQHKKLIHILC